MKKTLIVILPILLLLLFSCDAAGVYLGSDAPFTVLTSLDKKVQAEGTLLSAGTALVPSISGIMPAALDSAELQVLLFPVNPLDANGRAVLSRYRHRLVARYRSADTPDNRTASGDGDEETGLASIEYRSESFDEQLSPFSIPDDLEAGPWVINYRFVENESVQESISFRFICAPASSFHMDRLASYPPGPDSARQPVLPAGSMALFELSGRYPDGLSPVAEWYMAGEDLGRTAFEGGNSRLLHRMPEPDDEGVYSLRALVYPLDPGLYPDFPLRPLVKTLSLAVSLKDSRGDPVLSEAPAGANTALFFPLRGSLGAAGRPDIRLQPGTVSGEAEWVPLKNDYGLLAGSRSPWFIDTARADLPPLSGSPLRFLIDAAVHEDGQVGGGSILFSGSRSLNWRLNVYGQTALFSLVLSGESDSLVLVLEGARPDTRSRQQYSIDFELAGGLLHVRARSQSGNSSSLSLPLSEAVFHAWGPLYLGADPLFGEVKAAETVLHSLSCVAVPSFVEELFPDPGDIDGIGEQFLEI